VVPPGGIARLHVYRSRWRSQYALTLADGRNQVSTAVLRNSVGNFNSESRRVSPPTCVSLVRMAAPLQIINVVAGGQTFTGLYRVEGRVLTLKFAGHEVVGLTKNSDPERTAERLLMAVLNDRSARELKNLLDTSSCEFQRDLVK
jgi:hypothetical protein